MKAIVNARNAADQQLAPIGFSPESRAYILTMVEVLQVRGFEKDLGEAAQEKIDLDWIEDLAEFPQWAIDLACKRWRRVEGQKRAPYASGELMALVAKEMRDLRVIRSKARRVLKALAKNS